MHKKSWQKQASTKETQEHRLRDKVIAGMKQDQRDTKREKIVRNTTLDFKHGDNRVDR